MLAAGIITFVLLFSTLCSADFYRILPYAQTCMTAKLDYWTRYPDVAGAVLDPVWHYQNAPPAEGRTWDSSSCTTSSIYPNDAICNCTQAEGWFTGHYPSLGQTNATAFGYWIDHQTYPDGGLVWHCEYCYQSTTTTAPTGFKRILPYSETCVNAKTDYWTRYKDVAQAIIDPVYHYQNAPASEGRTWNADLCTTTSVYPNDFTCNCGAASSWFVGHYTWLGQSNATAFNYWVNHQTYADGGIVWHCEYCLASSSSPPTYDPSYHLDFVYTCLVAGWDYLARYPDVAYQNLDPVFHYDNSGHAEQRFWNMDLCNSTSIYPNNSFCNCTAAAQNYTNTYTWDKGEGVTLGTAFADWQSRQLVNGEAWHCELCITSGYLNSIDIRQFSAKLSGGLGAVIGVAGLLALFAAAMLWVYWEAFQSHGSFYSCVIVAGVFVSYISALVLLPPPSDGLCMAFPWLLGVAFILVYGCLFIKTWVLYRVWRDALKYKRSDLTASYIMRAIGVALGIEIVFLIIWTVVDPLTVRLTKMVDGTYQNQCHGDHDTFWIIFVAAKGVWLVFGVILSILTRGVVQEYNESSSIAYAIYNDIGLLIIGIPLALLLSTFPGGLIVIEVAVIVLSFTFTLCILFFDIWYKTLIRETDIVGDRIKSMSRSPTSSTSSTAPSFTASTKPKLVYEP